MTKTDELGAYFSKIHLLYQQWAKQNQLNYAELAVLHTTARNADCTQKQIGEEWMIPKQTVSLACNHLRAQGYIEFALTRQDKREKMMVLTDSGRAFIEPIINKMHAMEEQVFTQLGEENARQLIALMKDYSLAFERVMKAGI